MTSARPLPTDAELQLLQVLWSRGPSTVREIHEIGARSGSTGYTTTLKLLQIMHEKGLVRRDESSRSHIYRSAIPRIVTERRLVRAFLDRAFDGSAAKLVMRALTDERATPEELLRIQRLLDKLGGEDAAR